MDGVAQRTKAGTTNGGTAKLRPELTIADPEFILMDGYSVAVVDKDGFVNNLDPLHIVSARELSRRNLSS